jgi:prefoldin alpha subunit
MSEGDLREKIEEKSAEFEMLRRELETIDAQNSEISSRLSQFKSAVEIINQIKKAVPGQDIILPISEGLMIKAQIKDPKSALISVGNNIIIQKNSEDCESYIKERIDEADNLLSQLDAQALNITNKLRKLESELLMLTDKENEKRQLEKEELEKKISEQEKKSKKE